ncbi:glycosyltransferase [Roseibacillus persicicus]|uniref:glycosyltransferase n=1 Tax=Roseibacillus persicicus TaxID=454148 RepID=UPI0028100DAC|nr:glycosyltransferase [Roseibacillus persicicus]MDQ8190606.1 glycosyltransferase [Roseibacillus persicicus]
MSWLPIEVAAWLDRHWDLRTLLMAFGAAAVPGLLLIGWAGLRRLLLGLILFVLLSGEVWQLWVPTRTFSWIDIGFSVLGVGVVEFFSLALFQFGKWGTEKRRVPSGVGGIEGSGESLLDMKVLIYGLNYAPELTGIGRYTGEMGPWLKQQGVDVRVVTTPPYYPHWKIADGYSKFRFTKEEIEGVPVWRCPFYVPAKPTTVTRLIHLGSFAVTGFLGLWRHLLWRPDWVFMVEPASMTVPGGLIFAKVAGAKSWLHVQDFEMEAMLGLSKELGSQTQGNKTQEARGVAKKEVVVGGGLVDLGSASFSSPEGQGGGDGSVGRTEVCGPGDGGDGGVERAEARGPLGLRLAAGLEAWLKRRFDRTSSISQVMMGKLAERGIPEEKISFFPNWVDIDFMSPGKPKRDFREEWGIGEEECFVLYSGNIGRKQGLEMVLEVAERVQNSESRVQTASEAGALGRAEARGPMFQFVIVGEGAAKEGLMAEAEARGLQNIQFHPLQPYEDLPDLLRSADAHLVVQKRGAADAVLPSKLTSILSVGGNAVITAEPETELGRLEVTHPGMVTLIEPENAGVLADCLREKEAFFREVKLNQQARAYAERFLERDAILGQVRVEMLRPLGEVEEPAMASQ